MSVLFQEQDDDLFIFADEESDDTFVEHSESLSPWKILVVDDEEEIHSITKMVLNETSFDNRPLEIVSVYSGGEAVSILTESSDFAVILLDVVMENDHAGLETVHAIRNDLNNKNSRIILRTGQPGKAPERDVIVDYDINDYREKTELTAQKLYTSVIAAIRNYRDMVQLDKSRQGMQKVVESSALLFSNNSLNVFSENILGQFHSILEMGTSSREGSSGFVATDTRNGLKILAGSGEYEALIANDIPEEVQSRVAQVLFMKESNFWDDVFIGYFETQRGHRNVLYVDGIQGINEIDKHLIQVYCNNIAIAYENIYLNIDIIDTQKDIILRMGDVVETRSKETANHVYRVAEVSYLLAKKIGLSESDARILRHASPMHDVGKVGVPDDILLKPGKLTVEEFEVMKSHTTLGYNIFRNSHREIVQAAATIAHEHHERWDGSGYPRKLKGEEIHVFGRITALSDVFDALAHKRSYKEAWTLDDVFDYIIEHKGKIFDPALVEAFLEMKQEILDIQTLYPDH